jgi:4-hydroxy-2-oxoheptanedioate aldolase
MVNTPEEGRRAIAAAKYPPEGNRSVGGSAHSLGFDAGSGDYYLRANDEIVVVLQTESPQGIENAEAIYSLPGCDAIFIGPNDLRFNMRAPDGTMPTPEEHEAAIQQVIQMGKRTCTPTGIHVMDPQDALRRAEQGMQFLAVGSELRMMNTTAQQYVKTLWPEREAKDVARY